MAYTDELDEIRRDARTASTLRDGPVGQQAGQQELSRRLGAPDPALGEKLRAQPAQNMDAVRQRLASPPATPIREAITNGAQDMSEVKARLTPAQPTAAPAVPPRNVPLSAAPPQTTAAAEAARPYVQQVAAQPATNPNVGGGKMSAEAEAFLKQRAATPGSAVPEAAPAAKAAVSPISKVARAAGPAGLAISGMIEGQDVAKVAQDPNKSGLDVATQAGESAARVAGSGIGAYYGGMAGAGVGALTGPAAPVAVPVLGAIGAVAGGVAGPRVVSDVIRAGREGVNKLRAVFGLDPLDTNPPAASAVPQYERERKAAQPAAAPATPAQRPANAGATTVEKPLPARSISSVAQQAAAPEPKYVLGENAVQVIRPGGQVSYATFGANGPEGEVPEEVFNQGRTGEYRKTIAEAAMKNMTDPQRAVERAQVESQGRVEGERVQAAGRVAAAREATKAPVPLKNVTGETTGIATVQPGGDVQFHEVPKPKPPQAKALADARARLKQYGNSKEALDAINKQLDSWGYPALSLDK